MTNIFDSSYMDLNRTPASPTLSEASQNWKDCGGNSPIPTKKPFCGTGRDAKGNGGEAGCCGQRGHKHFGQPCVASLLPACSANLDTKKAIVAKGYSSFLRKGDGDWRPFAQRRVSIMGPLSG